MSNKEKLFHSSMPQSISIDLKWIHVWKLTIWLKFKIYIWSEANIFHLKDFDTT